jgi:hypothetical protein
MEEKSLLVLRSAGADEGPVDDSVEASLRAQSERGEALAAESESDDGEADAGQADAGAVTA